jgi:glutathione synthase
MWSKLEYGPQRKDNAPVTGEGLNMTEMQTGGSGRIRTGVIMDPVSGIKPWKDSTFAMMLEAQRRGHKIYYMEPAWLHVADGQPVSMMHRIELYDDNEHWFDLGDGAITPLNDLDVVLMRRDPPFDMDYIYITYMLDLAEAAGVLVVNRPQALRDANEKCFTTMFPQCCVPMIISRDSAMIRKFVSEHGDSVVKPLDGMGGTSIFRLNPADDNLNVILETITQDDSVLVMAQQYIAEISEGDKRILLINGEPVPYALARLAGEGDFRGNLAKGGFGKGVPLSERDVWISAQVAPELRRRGIVFAGLDVIGDWLTEINVTSPTCIRELDAEFGLNIAGHLFDVIEEKLGPVDRLNKS